MILARKIKLEVNEEDAKALEFMQGKYRGLYNWWIGKLRDGEKWPGWKKAKKTLQESKKYDPELEQVYGKLLLQQRLQQFLASYGITLDTVMDPRILCGGLQKLEGICKLET